MSGWGEAAGGAASPPRAPRLPAPPLTARHRDGPARRRRYPQLSQQVPWRLSSHPAAPASGTSHEPLRSSETFPFSFFASVSFFSFLSLFTFLLFSLSLSLVPFFLLSFILFSFFFLFPLRFPVSLPLSSIRNVKAAMESSGGGWTRQATLRPAVVLSSAAFSETTSLVKLPVPRV